MTQQRRYIGARYIPLFMGEWDSTASYEPLSVVNYEGSTYTSRQHVPPRIPLSNETFWALTGNYTGTPSDEQVISAVNAWLVAHPEATTTVEDNSLTTAKYQDSSITTAKIADGAVTNPKIANGAVTESKLSGSFANTTVGHSTNSEYSEIAGGADSLLGNTPTDETFISRISTHDGMARIDVLKGNTVRWNQLVSNPANATDWRKSGETSTASFGVENNALKITIGESTSGNFVISAQLGTNYISGHKYLLKAHTSNTNIDCRWNLLDNWSGGTSVLPESQGVQSVIATATSTSTTTPYAAITFWPFATPVQASGTVIYIYSISCFDLTAMFGAGNEPATVEEFERMYPESYYPYDAGSLLSVNVEGVNDREIPVATYFPNGMRGAGTAHDALYRDHYDVVMGVVDLGTLDWFDGGTGTSNVCRMRSLTPFTNAAKPSANNIAANIICAKYPTSTASLTYSNIVGIDIGSDGYIHIYDPDHNTSGSAETFASVVSGVYMYYELATPTTTQIDPPLNLTYQVEAGGTESVIVPTGEMTAPVPMAICYGYTAEGLRDESMSIVAPIENGKASTNYAIGAYFVHDGKLYKATSAIATGETITPGTNCTQTTVMAELVTLTA